MNDTPAEIARLRDACAGLNRRNFLRVTGGALALGLLPVGCGDVPPALQPPPELALAHLSPRGYATLRAAAMRLVGPAGATAIERGSLDPAAGAEGWIAASPELGEPLGQALALLEFGIPPLVRKWRPFTQLSGDAQDAVLRDLMDSRLDLKRDLFKGIRSLVFLAFYADPSSHVLTGFPGPFGGCGAALGEAMRYEPEL